MGQSIGRTVLRMLTHTTVDTLCIFRSWLHSLVKGNTWAVHFSLQRSEVIRAHFGLALGLLTTALGIVLPYRLVWPYCIGFKILLVAALFFAFSSLLMTIEMKKPNRFRNVRLRSLTTKFAEFDVRHIVSFLAFIGLGVALIRTGLFPLLLLRDRLSNLRLCLVGARNSEYMQKAQSAETKGCIGAQPRNLCLPRLPAHHCLNRLLDVLRGKAVFLH